jgi:putative tricarboxylic transport membrane protein
VNEARSDGAGSVPAPQNRLDRAGLVIAAGLAVIACIVAYNASTFQNTATYGMGPKQMPYIIAIGLGILAIGNLIMAMRGELPRREHADMRAVWMILGGLATLIAVIGLGGGFIIATTILFAATATAFGRRAIHIDLAIGFVLATVIYLAFGKLLTLSLPAGPLERLF